MDYPVPLPEAATRTTEAAALSSILVANRGEIAVRVIRAARDAGLRSIAVYSDQDRNSLHVRLADEAFSLDGDTAADTYLSIPKILSVAARAHADAVHPGYGFLSENPDFARAVIDAGLIWIGPSPEAIEQLGDKVSARHVAEKVGAPLAPGTVDPVTSPEEILAFADRVGLPIAIKAAFGGGGRGLKVAYTRDEIATQFESATREAVANFGRGECFVEKFLDHPRHIETQCLADAHGNVVVVGTRDCSLQRRNQKLVEEAPAPFLTDEQRTILYRASKAILHEVGYTGAATCEFLLGTDGTLSFLEVNTRLQVEHTVTEQTTGIDLVREQFRIASGGMLDYPDQEPVGHAFEFRINGEDPGNSFLPTPGTIHVFHAPDGPGVRTDSGYEAGDTVSGAFDSLLAKLVITGTSREQALERSRRALNEFEITGVPTVLPFHRAVVLEPDFTAEDGTLRTYTQWIEKTFHMDLPAWSGTADLPNPMLGERETVVVEVAGKRLEVSVPRVATTAATASTALGLPPRRRRRTGVHSGTADGVVTAPMQASVIAVNVSPGDTVVRGDALVVLEAMKMEQPILAPRDGVIATVGPEVGTTVSSGQVLVTLEPAATKAPLAAPGA